jgi:4-diphosphocytidyl-2-C-methyl-D-erythritol kinase
MVQTTLETAVTCRAKINLTLDILGRRPDGYHNLESVMQSVDVSDVLQVCVTTGSGIKIATDMPGIPSGPSNTVYKACALFKDAAEVDCGIAVSIEKRIPIEAGLGGGSSNAAAALLALNSMFEDVLTVDELIAVAARVGSDVPYFVTGGTALVSGKGELIRELPAAPELDLVIAKPEKGVSTSWAYGRLAATPGRKSAQGSEAMMEAVHSGDRQKVVAAISNDFDAVVCKAFPAIAALKGRLLDLGAEAAMLCGSGSGMFGVFSDPESAASAAEALSADYPFAVATRTTPSAVTFGENDAD